MSTSPNIQLVESILQLKTAAARRPIVPVPLPPSPPSLPSLASVQRQENDLWHQWNSSGRQPEYLQPLYTSYKPLIEKHARTWVNRVELPPSTIYHELDKHFVSAMHSYDPERGANLGTWLHTNLQKAGRFVKSYQNIGKIPETQISKIRQYQQAKSDLTDRLGYEPDSHAIAEHLNWHPRQVAQLSKELRRDLPASGFQFDPVEHLHPKELEAVTLIQYGLTPQERSVYEYTFGMGGKPVLAPGQIAKQVGLHPSKISRIRKSLQGKIQEALQVL